MKIAIFSQSQTCEPCKNLLKELNKRFGDKWRTVVEYYDLQAPENTEMINAMRYASQAKVKRVPEILIQHDDEILRFQDGKFDLKEFYGLLLDVIEGVADPKILKVDFTGRGFVPKQMPSFLDRVKSWFKW